MSKQNNGQSAGQVYDVVIIGGGVTGTALLYSLVRFTDLHRVALIERRAQLASVNSKATSNSQTIHCGDIETNYTLDKALQVRRVAQMVVRYAEILPAEIRDRIIYRFPKMVLGVGAQEVNYLRQRYEIFKPHFAGMELLEKHQIAEVEPLVVRTDGGDRPEDLVAIAVANDYTAVNYAALAQSFVAQAQALGSAEIDLHVATPVKSIEPVGNNYHVVLPDRRLVARFVVISAGGHSLLFAHRLGFGLHYSCLPMAGSFYFTPAVLRGKVYTVQNDRLPFAAIHGDPDITVPGKTRFGPTALPLPLLERDNPNTLIDYLQVLRPDPAVVSVLWDLMKVKDIRNYLFKNIAFEIPYFNRHLFLQDVHKIIPSLRLADLEFAHGFGGIRPQLIDKRNQQLILGQASIDVDGGLRFNVTPSPGATNCLGNAEQDLLKIQSHLGCQFDQQRFERELVAPLAPTS